jgi:hypothetical protein
MEKKGCRGCCRLVTRWRLISDAELMGCVGELVRLTGKAAATTRLYKMDKMNSAQYHLEHKT